MVEQKIKALLFDPFSGAKEVYTSNNREDWHNLLDCNMVEMPYRDILGEEYTIICDEEALLKGKAYMSLKSMSDLNLGIVNRCLIAKTDYSTGKIKSVEDDFFTKIKSRIQRVIFHDEQNSAGYIMLID